MKNTPNVPANAPANNNAKVVSVGDLINKANQTPDGEVKQPTTYPQTAKPEAEPTPEPATTPAPEPAPTMALIKTRSRAEEVAYQVEKSRQMQLINTQLVSLTDKQAELKQFSYDVNKDDDYRYGRIAIYDDKNREFVCKNHGVAALIVKFLLTVFGEKIDEKETELLTVAKS